MTGRFGVIAFLALAAVSTPVAAQQAPQTITFNGKEVPFRQNLVSVNPLGLVFEYFSGEIEHAMSRSASIAVSGSYASPYDLTYTSLDVIGRYYPSEAGLRGFSIGPTVGYTHVRDDYACYGGCSTNSTNAFTAGIQIDYSWILGPSQHFGIELGLGAKRLFYQGNAGDGSDALPTGRLSVGYAF